MNVIYNSRERFIVHNTYKSNKKKHPHIIFLHGLMSDCNSTKAQYIFNYCSKQDYTCTIFDNYGHGKSSGKFTEQTIGSWLEGLESVIQNIEEVLLIGSSMGAWVSLLAAVRNNKKIKAIIGLATAADFTEEYIWRKLPIEKQNQMISDGILMVGGEGNCAYPISYNLIAEARNHLLLNKETININCPIHLIHGKQDTDIAYNVSTRLVDKLTSREVVLKLIKDADHKLHRPSDLKIITNSIEELCSY